MGSIAQIYPQFQDHLAAIAAFSNAAADATQLSGQRMWMLPPVSAQDTYYPGTWDGDPWSWVSMIYAWNRAEINDDYSTIIGDPAQEVGSGEAMVVKLQMDYIATMERAFRTRHASSVRCRIHAAARRIGHGSATGPLQGTIVTWLTRIWEAANNNPYGTQNPATQDEADDEEDDEED